MKPYPPLGILYICAHLRSKGLSVEVFDSTFSSRQQLFDLLRQGPPVGAWHLCESDDPAQCRRDSAGRKGGGLADGCRRTGAGRLCR